MQKVLFITNVEYLKITSNLGHGDEIGDEFLLTNDKSFIGSLITPIFREYAGALETHYLKTAHTVAYSIEEVEPFPDDKAADLFLIKRLAQVKSFMHMLWLVKDNAANVDLGYVECPYKANSASISRNSFSQSYCTSQGESKVVTEFSRHELRKAREIHRKLSPEVSLNTQCAVEDRFGRFDRAFYFLHAARSSSDLGVKIANYCTCLESLFSSDAIELSHKLSERVACFLETDLTGRLKLFHIMKKAYNIRSKVVHGAKGSPNLQQGIIEAASSCDDIIRRVLLTILNNPSLEERFIHKKHLTDEEYFVSLVLSPCEHKKADEK